MPYTRQLLVSFLFSALAFVIFFMSTYAFPAHEPGREESILEIVLTSIVMLGLLVSFVLTVSFGTSALVWRINGGEPDRQSMPLGARIKGAGVILVVAILAYASFYLF